MGKRESQIEVALYFEEVMHRRIRVEAATQGQGIRPFLEGVVRDWYEKRFKEVAQEADIKPTSKKREELPESAPAQVSRTDTRHDKEKLCQRWDELSRLQEESQDEKDLRRYLAEAEKVKKELWDKYRTRV